MSRELDDIRLRIKNRRYQLGYTYDEFSKLTGMSKSTLQRYETGGIENLPLDKVTVLAKALQCSPAHLMGWDVPQDGAPQYSSEALRIAKRFDELDEYGQSAVSGLVNVEYARCTAFPDAGNTDNCLYLPLSEQPASAGTGVYLGPEAFEQVCVIDNEKTRKADFAVRIQGDSMEPLYQDGDIVLISKEQPEQGAVALVTLDGCGYVKRIGDGVLLSENKRYEPIQMNESIVVNGRVLGVLLPEWIIG